MHGKGEGEEGHEAVLVGGVVEEECLGGGGAGGGLAADGAVADGDR